jgi:hypothetical protein
LITFKRTNNPVLFFEIALNVSRGYRAPYLHSFALHCDRVFEKIISSFDDNITGLAEQEQRLAHLADIRRKESAYIAATYIIVDERVHCCASNAYGTVTDVEDRSQPLTFADVVAASPATVELDDLKQIYGHLTILVQKFESEIAKFNKFEICVGSAGSNNDRAGLTNPPNRTVLSDKSVMLINHVENEMSSGKIPEKGALPHLDKKRVDRFLVLAYQRYDACLCPISVAEQCELLFQKIQAFCDDANKDNYTTDQRLNLLRKNEQCKETVYFEAVHMAVVHRLKSGMDYAFSGFCENLYGPFSKYCQEVYENVFWVLDRIVDRNENQSNCPGTPSHTTQSSKLSKRTCKKKSRSKDDFRIRSVINGELRHLRYTKDSHNIEKQCTAIFQNALACYNEKATTSLAAHLERYYTLKGVKRKQSSYIRAILLVVLENEYCSIHGENARSRPDISIFEKVANISFNCNIHEFKTIYQQVKHWFYKFTVIDAPYKIEDSTRSISSSGRATEGIRNVKPYGTSSKYMEMSNLEGNDESGNSIRKPKKRTDLPICGKERKRIKTSPITSHLSLQQNSEVVGALSNFDCNHNDNRITKESISNSSDNRNLILKRAAESIFQKYGFH